MQRNQILFAVLLITLFKSFCSLITIDGKDGSWKLPLPPLSISDVEPYGPSIDQGEVAARHEAALKVSLNTLI